MTGTQWRVALEGRYYRLFSAPSNTRSSASDIEKLSFEPSRTGPDPSDSGSPAELGKRRREPSTSNDFEEGELEDHECVTQGPSNKKSTSKSKKSASQRKSQAARKQRNLADRQDINVRFGVHAGFPPYDPTVSVSVPFMGTSVRLVDIDKRIWGSVAWEISVIQSHLEFLDLELQLLPELYLSFSNQDEAMARVSRITSMWGEEFDLSANAEEKVTSLDWSIRSLAIKDMAAVMRLWPKGRESLPSPAEEVTADYEVKVIDFYLMTFNRAYGRLPTIPLVKPSYII